MKKLLLYFTAFTFVLTLMSPTFLTSEVDEHSKGTIAYSSDPGW